MDIELGKYAALAVPATRGVDVNNAIHHEHIANRKACIAGAEHVAMATAQQLITVITALGFEHGIHHKYLAATAGTALGKKGSII